MESLETKQREQSVQLGIAAGEAAADRYGPLSLAAPEEIDDALNLGEGPHEGVERSGLCRIGAPNIQYAAWSQTC